MNARPKGKSKYKGVSVTTQGKRIYYIAEITENRNRHYLGCFKDEVMAATEYDKAAKIYHKEFANLNFK